MLGQGWLISRGVRAILEEFDVDENTAKWIGKGCGWTIGLLTFDWSIVADAASGIADVMDVASSLPKPNPAVTGWAWSP